MKTSELIANLQASLIENGDLDVYANIEHAVDGRLEMMRTNFGERHLSLRDSQTKGQILVIA